LLSGKSIDWLLGTALAIGVAFSTPLAALIVKKLESKYLKLIIGGMTIILGTLTVFKTVRIL
jgi:uncharacterized membrane protein YfcA